MDDARTPLQRAKYPRTILAGPYGHPFHGILVTVPIGSWTAAIVFDVVALILKDGSAFAVGARTLIAIGVVGALVAAVLGFIDFTGIPARTHARRIAFLHMIANLTAVVVFVISFMIRLGAGDRFSAPGFVVALVGIALIAFSGFLGGELVYRYGVRVADEATQEHGYR